MSLKLSKKNSHPRDLKLKFDEPTHTYTIDSESNYKSVTTWIHDFFPGFNADKIIEKMRKSKTWTPDNKYFYLTNDQIKSLWKNNGKQAAKLGTEMHLNIENYYNGVEFSSEFKKTKEYKIFRKYLEHHKNYIPYRTEWAIFTKKYRLAGSIDMVYHDPEDKDKVIIVDWKRCKELKFDNKWEKAIEPISDIPNCNFWHYTLQLNVYRMILEKYYNLNVSKMYLVVIHPDFDNYQKYYIQKITDPIIKMLKKRKEELQEK